MKTDRIKKYLKHGIGIPLILWGGINVLSGILLFFEISLVVKGIVIQAVFWGLIDGIIGLVPFFTKREQNPERIKRILFVNIFLDGGYIIGGILLVFLSSREILIGSGYGILIQGIFLLIADVVHHRTLTTLIHAE